MCRQRDGARQWLGVVVRSDAQQRVVDRHLANRGLQLRHGGGARVDQLPDLVELRAGRGDRLHVLSACLARLVALLVVRLQLRLEVRPRLLERQDLRPTLLDLLAQDCLGVGRLLHD